MVLLLILAYGIVAVPLGGRLVSRKHWHDLIFFGILMAASFALFFLLLIGVKIPNPIDALQQLYDKIGLHY